MARAYPASTIQQQFWVAEQLARGSAAYNVCNGFAIKGAFEPERFRHAVLKIVEMQDIFRTRYEMRESGLFQIVSSDAEIEYTYKCIDGGEAFKKEAMSLVEADARRSFDLATGPMVRLLVVSNSENDQFHVLISVHHIAIDLRTKDLFSGLIEQFYTDAETQPTKQVAVSYETFCEWEQDFLTSPRALKMKQFWKEYLSGKTLSLPLIYDFIPPQGAGFNGTHHPFVLDEPLVDKLESVGRETRIDPYVILLSAYNLMLANYTRSTECIVGVPLSNRLEEPFNEMFGCFVNTLPVATTLDMQADVQTLLQTVRKGMLLAHRSQAVSTEQIVGVIGAQTEKSRNPIYQVGFTFEHPMKLTLPSLDIEPLDIDTKSAQLELFMRMWREGGRVKGRLEYNTDLFSEDTASRMVTYYKALVETMLDHLDAPLKNLAPLPPSDREQLGEWNRTEKPYDLLPLHQAFEQQVDRTPDRDALRFNGESLTYKQFDEKANQVARYIRQFDIRPGDRVVVCMHRSFDMLLGIYGALKSGAAYVPVDPEAPVKRRETIIEDIAPKVVLTEEKLKSDFENVSVPVVAMDTAAVDFAKEELARLNVDVKNSDVAYVIYTSGSTGKPKGAANSHAGIANQLIWKQEMYQLQADDVALLKTPYTFDVSVWELFWPCQVGATLEIALPGEHRDPVALWKRIQHSKTTTLNFVPSMLEVFISSGIDFSNHHVRRLVCIGEALSADLKNRFLEKFPTVQLSNLYGPAEAAVSVTSKRCEVGDDLFVSIGKPCANTRMYVLNDTQQTTPIGVPGEICIGGIQVGMGYWNNPELSQKVFVDDPFSTSNEKMYRTGDLGTFLPNGEIRFLGRLDFQVKIRGNRIETGEIESVLRLHSKVQDAVVVAKVLSGTEPSLVGYVAGSSDISASELKEHIGNQLPHYMIPSFIVVLDKLPLNTSGKVDRKSLPEVDLAKELSNRKIELPKSEIEANLLTLWRRVLSVEEISTSDNFMDVGGSSLMLMRVSAELQKEWGERASILNLLQYTSIAQLAKFLGNDDSNDSAMLKKAKQRAEKTKSVRDRRKNARQRMRPA